MGDRREGDKIVSSTLSSDEADPGEELCTGTDHGDEQTVVGEVASGSSNLEDEDSQQFLKSQQLYLEQLELYNTV